MATSAMLRHVALVRTDVSEELSASFIRVTRIGELGTTLAVTSNRRTQHAPFFTENKVHICLFSVSFQDSKSLGKNSHVR
jgi:hypothetical protein